MKELLPKELENKLWRMEKYRELLKDKYSLYTIQRDYNLPPKELLEYLRQIEIKLLTDKKLTRDDRVYLNTFERVYQS
jgi:hypothetical protein